MIGLLMCGGLGRRLGLAVEKPLLRIGGRPMVDRVLEALEASRLAGIVAVASPAAPVTAARVADRVPTVDAPGDGYVADLRTALAELDGPALVVAADLPLLTGPLLDDVLERYAAEPDVAATVAVPVARKRALGLSVDAVLSTDVNGASGGEAPASCMSNGPPERDGEEGTIGPRDGRQGRRRGRERARAGTRGRTRGQRPGRGQPGGLAPTGVNVVVAPSPVDGAREPHPATGSSGRTIVIDDRRLAVNVNRPRDAWVAEVLS